ncbi:MAG: hypothetical protein LC624_05335 [Halobacteriales archaeon]|nr:hypothetical protein [Halobacteriales archaeon]
MQRSRRGHSERASASAVEAMFLATFVLISLAIVGGLLHPSETTPNSSYRPVQLDAADILQGWSQLSTGDAYQHLLDKIIAKAYTGNTTDLDRSLERALPPGAGHRVWLDNGHARKLLAGPTETSVRQAVSATQLWHPAWDYVATIPGYDAVPPLMAVPFESVAVAQGALVQEAGIPVLVNLTTSNGTYQSAFVTSLGEAPSVSLTLQDADGNQGYTFTDPQVLPNITIPVYSNAANGPPVSANFTVPSGALALNVSATATGVGSSYTLTLTEPGKATHAYTVTPSLPLSVVLASPMSGSWNLTAVQGAVRPSASTVGLTALQPHANVDWVVTVNETAGKALPAGSMLVVRFPAPFDASGQNTTQGGWQDIAWTRTADGGSEVTARLATALSGATRSFTAYGDRGLNPLSALNVVRAWMNTTDTASRSTFVVTGVNALTTPVGNPVQHQLYVSGPKPMRPGAWANWAFTLTYPSAVSNPALTETLQGMEVWTPGGEDIFGSLTQAELAEWSKPEPGHLHWAPRITESVPMNGMQTIPLSYIANGSTTPTEPTIRVPINFDNDYADTFFDQAEQAYVYKGAFPPASPAEAKNGATVPLGTGPVNVTNRMYARSALLQGQGKYNVSYAVPLSTYADALKLGLFECNLTIDTPKLRIGESTSITVNFTGLLARLAQNMDSWGIDIDVYDPAQPFAPLAEWKSMLTASVFYGSPQLSSGTFSMTFLAGDDSFYGPHVVVAQGHFRLMDGGTSVPIMARRIAVINVVPDGGQAETSLYWVILEAWMPDWS